MDICPVDSSVTGAHFYKYLTIITYMCLGWPCAMVRNMSGYGFLDTNTTFKFEMTLAILNIV